MLPGILRTLIVVAAALATVLAGVWEAFAETRWAGTSISSTECLACDYGREDESGRAAEACEAEDLDDEDDRVFPLGLEAFPVGEHAIAVAFLGCQERRLHRTARPLTTHVRGPPAAL